MGEIVKSYIGVGRVHARPFGSTGKFRHVGNVEALNLKQTLDTQKQRDYTRTGGGTAVRVDRIESVEAAMTWLTFSAENWALACAGEAHEVAAGSVTVAEVVKGYKGATVRLAHPPSNIDLVTNVGGTTTYVAGTDYVMSAGGLEFPDTSTITEAADLKVTYDYAAYTRIEGAVSSGVELELWFEGLNEADADAPVLVDLWRVSMPAAEEVALIGTELGQMQFASELLKDGSKGTGASAFYRVRLVDSGA